MNKTFTLTLLLMAFIIGCIPDDEPLYNCEDPIPEYRLDEDFKAYLDFQLGTYWVYEDSLSRMLDSVYIISNRNEIKEGISGRGCDARFRNEFIYMQQFSNGKGEQLTASTTFSGFGYQYYNPQGRAGSLYKQKNEDKPSEQTIIKRDTIQNLTFENDNFSDVIIAMSPLRDSLGLSSDTLIQWWAKGIGVIRKESKDGGVQRIKNFNIIK
jgi:hypothetical protein